MVARRLSPRNEESRRVRFFQRLPRLKSSVTVWIGDIACFGMATSTGIIMLVYLREAVAKAGGLERIDLTDLRLAVLNGAVHRLRPKFLTEGTVVLGLAPMLWASGKPPRSSGRWRHLSWGASWWPTK